MDAGMAPAAESVYAGTISADEAKSTRFLKVLRDKLAAGTPAAEAIVWARFTPLAGEFAAV